MTAIENLLVCQNLSKKNRRPIWREFAASPRPMNNEAEKREDPIRFEPVLFEAPTTSPMPVARVARTICFGTLYRSFPEKRIVDRKTPAEGGRATKRKVNCPAEEIWDEKAEFWRM